MTHEYVPCHEPVKFTIIAVISAALMLAMGVVSGGCASGDELLARPDHFPPGVPRSAALVRSGTGKLVFEAIDPGRVYLYDADVAAIIAAAHIQPGQRLIVDPATGSAAIEGRSVFPVGDPGLNRRHGYRIYFDGADKSPTTAPAGG